MLAGVDALAGTPESGVDWHRRAFELATGLGRIGPLTDAGDYAAALRAVAEVDRALPHVIAGLVDEGRAAGLNWTEVGAALDRHPATARGTYSRRNRHRLGNPNGRPAGFTVNRRQDAAGAAPGDNSNPVGCVA